MRRTRRDRPYCSSRGQSSADGLTTCLRAICEMGSSTSKTWKLVSDSLESRPWLTPLNPRTDNFVIAHPTGGGCMAGVQGVVKHSEAYKQLLRQHAACAMQDVCPSAAKLTMQPGMSNWWGMPPNQMRGVQCLSSKNANIVVDDVLSGASIKVFRGSNDLESTYAAHLDRLVSMMPNEKEFDCRIMHDPMVGPVYVGESRLRRRWTSTDATFSRIGLLIPTTTEATQLSNPDSLPALNILLSSFLQMLGAEVRNLSLTCLACGGILQGAQRFPADRFDRSCHDLAVYDNEAKRERILKRCTTLIGDNPVQVKLYRFPVSKSTTYIWNGLMDIAMQDGNDYFMAAHDDTEFYPSANSKAWADVLVAALAGNGLHQNFGVAGPLDMRSPKMISHGTHHDIFKWMFPPELRNSELDEWLSRIHWEKQAMRAGQGQCRQSNQEECGKDERVDPCSHAEWRCTDWCVVTGSDISSHHPISRMKMAAAHKNGLERGP
eukprot:scaffold2404_cov398-Prasinococcus_capsulatus_cf.AAC.31